MTVITMHEYLERKMDFMKKHGEWKESGNVSGETINKILVFEDGATWTEITRPVYEKTTVTVKGLNLKTTVKLYETEIYNTDNSKSVYLYEA